MLASFIIYKTDVEPLVNVVRQSELRLMLQTDDIPEAIPLFVNIDPFPESLLQVVLSNVVLLSEYSIDVQLLSSSLGVLLFEFQMF